MRTSAYVEKITQLQTTFYEIRGFPGFSNDPTR